MSVDTTAGAPTTCTGRPPIRRRLSSRHSIVVIGCAAAEAIQPATARVTALRRMLLLPIERANQHAHVANVGLDRDPHQFRIRVWRGVGLVAYVGLRKVAGL